MHYDNGCRKFFPDTTLHSLVFPFLFRPIQVKCLFCFPTNKCSVMVLVVTFNSQRRKKEKIHLNLYFLNEQFWGLSPGKARDLAPLCSLPVFSQKFNSISWASVHQHPGCKLLTAKIIKVLIQQHLLCTAHGTRSFP